jgi:hypothetical protein
MRQGKVGGTHADVALDTSMRAIVIVRCKMVNKLSLISNHNLDDKQIIINHGAACG